MEEKLSGVAHTSSQAQEIAESILSLVKKIEEVENESQKQKVAEILEKSQEMNNNNKGGLFYYKAIELFKKHHNIDQLNPESLSRIYYSIANMKKDQ